MSERRRGPYKRYLTDPTARIPRQTRFNWRKQPRISSPTHHGSAPSNCDTSASSASEGEDDATREPQDSDSPEDNRSGSDNADLSDDGIGAHPSPTHSLLYEGAQISEDMGMMLLMCLATKHKMSFSELADLKVVCMHFPAGTSVPTAYKSVYRLLKKVAAMESDLAWPQLRIGKGQVEKLVVVLYLYIYIIPTDYNTKKYINDIIIWLP